MKRPSLILVCLTSLIISCGKIDVFEKNVAIPGQAWKSDFTPVIEFEVTDTVSLYRLQVVLRYTDAYAYKNIWVNIGYQAPGDSMIFNKWNLTLANDNTGWLGKGMDDIFEHRILFGATPGSTAGRFPKPGVYKFSLQQIMRDDPLEHVLNAGVRVEKVQQ